jgi:hypothetical protein
MSIIDQAVAHYAAQERLIISVPEWGTEENPLQIHVFPMTMAEVNMIQSISKKNASNMDHAINIILIKARDAQGNRLFKLEDKDNLMQRADYRVIARITEAIEAKFFGEVETHKRNLRGSPCDTSS